MSAIEHTPRTVQRTPASRKPRVTVAQLFLRAVRRWQTKRAIAELNRLDDKQLEDAGISRKDIPRVVAGILRREEAPPSERAPAPMAEGVRRQAA